MLPTPTPVTGPPSGATAPQLERSGTVRPGFVAAVALIVATVVLATALWVATIRYYEAALQMEVAWDWWGSLVAVTPWLARVLLWYAVCWTATRARATSRTVAVPAALAVGGVVALSVATFVWPSPELATTWLGPTAPYVPDDLSHSLTVTNPAVWFPVLAALGLAVASWCGARSGRAGGVVPLRRPSPVATAATVLVPGLPVLALAVGATFAWWEDDEHRFHTADDLRWFTAQVLLLLIASLVAAVLLSGTGRAGALVVGLLALAAGVGPVADWWYGGADWWTGGHDNQLVLGVCSALACVLAATWRPAAYWLDDVLDPLPRG